MHESEARFIASEWHGGQWSALYSFSSTGSVENDDTIREIDKCIQNFPEGVSDVQLDLLHALRHYITSKRTPLNT